jgi:hypothetical protein
MNDLVVELRATAHSYPDKSINAIETTETPIIAVFMDALGVRFAKQFGFETPKRIFKPNNKGWIVINPQDSTETKVCK